MAPLPPPTPSPPEPTGARVPLRTRLTTSDVGFQQSGSELILAKLREMIAEAAEETDTILGTIAVAAHSLTGASGAAIAMPRDGAVVCVGRSGETAPELGDRLNVNSGISGECLRTGMSLRCDDASRDLHVDADVCRQLGLRSIAVVPLRGQYGRVGVLETFSTQAYAFTEDKMELLERLAGLAETAWAQRSETESLREIEASGPEMADVAVSEPEAAETVPPAQDSHPTHASHALERVEQAIATGLHRQRQAELKVRRGAIAALSLVIVCLLSLIAWTVWGRGGKGSASKQPATRPQIVPAERPDVAAGVGLTWRPSAGRPASRPKAVPPRATGSIADSEIADAVVRRQPAPAQTRDNANTGTPPDSTPGADDAPEIAASGAGQDLGKMFSTSATLPKLSAPTSQGVAGGTLVHKVQPVYPSEARRMHLEGTVILEAVVTEQGQIENLKLVSGHPILAQAAIEAVSKWRYSPYLLNGKPTQKQTRISVSFLAP